MEPCRIDGRPHRFEVLGDRETFRSDCSARNQGFLVGMMSTGQGAICSKRCATLPRRRPLSGPLPTLPSTMRSAPDFAAASAIAWAGPLGPT